MSFRTLLVIISIVLFMPLLLFSYLHVPPDLSPRYDESAVTYTLKQAIRASESGAPHRGPENRTCSARFVQDVYRDLFGLRLPGSMSELMEEGKVVDREDIAPGDLLFFGEGSYVHGGFFIGDGEFGHCERSTGARIDRLDDPSWSSRYSGARRVID